MIARRIGVAGWVGLLLGTAACGDQELRSHTAVVAVSTDIRGINPLTAGAARMTREITDRMFLRLFEENLHLQDGPPTWEPSLAQRWWWNDDRTELTVELDASAQWSDGTPVTTRDVLWTLEAQTNPDVAWPFSAAKDRIDRLTSETDHRFTAYFSEPYATQLADLNEGPILPQHVWGALEFSAWRNSGSWFLEHLAVNGPFRLDSWNPGDSIVLSRNDAFGGAAPALDALTVRVVPHPATRIAELVSGSVDLIDAVSPHEARRIATHAGLVVDRSPSRRYEFLCWNLQRPFLSEQAVREALTLAIDRAGITRALLGLFGRVGTSPIPSSVWGHDTSLRPRPFDPTRARNLLASVGFSDSDGDGVLERDGVPLAIALTTNADNRTRVDALIMIQHQLAAIGVDATVRPVEFNALLDRNLSGDFDATLGAWAIDTTLDLGYAFHSDSIRDGYNYGGYRNPEVDRLIEAARNEVTPAVRRNHLLQIQRHLDRDLPYTILWEPDHLSARRQTLTGVEAGPMGALFRAHRWTWSGTSG